MVPGHVQGLSRMPPDHPEGAAGGGLYSEDLWRTPWGECGMRNSRKRLLQARYRPGNLEGNPR